MKGQELKILFRDNFAFLTEEVALDFNQVKISDLPFKFQSAAFWTIRVISHIQGENRLHVEVLSYHVGETEFSENQIELADMLITIEKVTFKSIDTSGLFKTLYGKEPLKFLPPKPEAVHRPEKPMQSEIKIEREPILQTYNEPFSIPIKNVTFLSGKVVFEKKIQHFKKTIGFQILNEDIIEAYDAIKNYFSNVLKTKKIQVIPTILTVDGAITSVNATSVEIEKIDKSLLEEIKFEFIKNAKRKESPVDKQLFTMEEYLESFAGEDLKGQQVFEDENEFFETLLKKSETKHYKHLRFLSSKHKHEIQKLRFVHKPFSFVFLLSSIDKFYIVWETLDTSEATYIRTVANNVEELKQVLARTDKIINLIIREGKNEYISRKEENFNRVFHDYTDLQNGFEKWKDDAEKIVL